MKSPSNKTNVINRTRQKIVLFSLLAIITFLLIHLLIPTKRLIISQRSNITSEHRTQINLRDRIGREGYVAWKKAHNLVLAESNFKECDAIGIPGFTETDMLAQVQIEMGKKREALENTKLILWPPPRTGSTLQDQPAIWLRYIALSRELNQPIDEQAVIARAQKNLPKALGGAFPPLTKEHLDNFGYEFTWLMLQGIEQSFHGEWKNSAKSFSDAYDESPQVIALLYRGDAENDAQEYGKAAATLSEVVSRSSNDQVTLEVAKSRLKIAKDEVVGAEIHRRREKGENFGSRPVKPPADQIPGG